MPPFVIFVVVWPMGMAFCCAGGWLVIFRFIGSASKTLEKWEIVDMAGVG